MAKKYEHEITVYVWKYKKVLGSIPTGHFGHVAVRLRNVPGGEDTYISWWPGKGASIGTAFKKGAQEAELGDTYVGDKLSEMRSATNERLLSGDYRARSGQRLYMFDEFNDRTDDPDAATFWSYGQSADVKVRLPAAGLGGIIWGLDIVSMYRWWNVFRRSPTRQYRLLGATDNCAGVAALALLAGLADAYVEPPRVKVFRDPTQLYQWAKQVEQTLEKLNNGGGLYHPTMHGFAKKYKHNLSNELMSLKEFKTLSGEGVKWWVVRKGQAHKIDGMLAEYHSIPWNGSENMEKRWARKIQLLKDMMNQIHLYLAEKPTGKRREAMVTLGEQIIALINLKFGDANVWNKNVVKWDNFYYC